MSEPEPVEAAEQRQPVPSHIRLIRPKAEPSRPTSPDAPATPPDPPDWLDDGAKIEWRRLAPVLAAHWRPEFIDVLAVYACALAQFKRRPDRATPAMLAQIRLLQGTLGLSPRSQASLARERGR